jgi:alpha-glucosidase
VARTHIATTVRSPRFGADWWQRGVVYQIYPRSFADSNGDGIGDLPGIIDHLDYLGPNGLGVDALWLSPIYPSPGLDVGYDVSDHAGVDPIFGSEADFDRLIDEAHKRGLRVILDLVLNHTSDQHAWFQASRASRTGPYADWYLWRDPAGRDGDGHPLPPNNWVSFFGGPGWQWDPKRKQFYFHTFLVEQPELNWRAPGVEAAQFDVVRGWLARGVDGFRLDVFNAFLKDPDLRSNPDRDGATAWARQDHRFDRDQPDFPDLIGRFRAIVDEAPGRMSVGELFDGSVERASSLSTDRHLVFDWELTEMPWRGPAVRETIEHRERVFGERWPTAVMSNHDQPRPASRYSQSGQAPDPDAVARGAAVLLLTLRGTPFLYAGEELGLQDVDVPATESVDPPAHRFTSPDFSWWDRSRCRTPIPWRPGSGAGFTTGRPWLRLNPDADARNVAVELEDPGSVLNTYRRLIALRASSPALQTGTLRLLPDTADGVVAYIRERGDASVVVALNPSRAANTWAPSAGVPDTTWRIALRTGERGDAANSGADAAEVSTGTALELEPDEGIVLVRTG